jgi:hypothetical protein
MEVVAVIVPVVVKMALMLMPLPPVVALAPPLQFEKSTSPLLVNAPPRETPWLEVPVPPVQLINVTVPVVPVVQPVVVMPCAPEPVAVLAPVIFMLPEEEVMPFAVAIKIPALPAEPEAAPTNKINPLPVVVEITPPL